MIAVLRVIERSKCFSSKGKKAAHFSNALIIKEPKNVPIKNIFPIVILIYEINVLV